MKFRWVDIVLRFYTKMFRKFEVLQSRMVVNIFYHLCKDNVNTSCVIILFRLYHSYFHPQIQSKAIWWFEWMYKKCGYLWGSCKRIYLSSWYYASLFYNKRIHKRWWCIKHWIQFKGIIIIFYFWWIWFRKLFDCIEEEWSKRTRL